LSPRSSHPVMFSLLPGPKIANSPQSVLQQSDLRAILLPKRNPSSDPNLPMPFSSWLTSTEQPAVWSLKSIADLERRESRQGGLGRAVQAHTGTKISFVFQTCILFLFRFLIHISKTPHVSSYHEAGLVMLLYLHTWYHL
jgi:hypothetical protein